MRSTEHFSAEVGVALLAFNEEAVLYCRSIVNDDAHEYAMDYARMLRGRAKGLGLELDDLAFRRICLSRTEI
jgi:hypothetical protein